MFNLDTFSRKTHSHSIDVVLLFLFPVGFFLVKHWTTTLSFIIFLFCAFHICRNLRDYGSIFRRTWLTLTLVFLSPLIIDTFVVLFRGDENVRQLDASSRALMAGIVFIFFQRKEIAVERIFPYAALACVISAEIYLLFDQSGFRGMRAATYFVDPLTLGIFLLALSSFYITSLFDVKTKPFQYPVLIVLTTLGIYTLIKTESRAAWLACLVFIEFLLIFLCRKKLTWIYVNIALLSSLLLIFYFSETIQRRVLEVFDEVIRFSQGDISNSSIGVRFELIKFDIALLGHSILGHQDGYLPPLSQLQSIYPDISEEPHFVKLAAGSHNEIFAQLSRRGLVAGIFGIIGGIFLPFWILIKNFKSRDVVIRDATRQLFFFLLILLIGGVGTEVLSTKMSVTLYFFVIAFYLARIFSRRYFLLSQKAS